MIDEKILTLNFHFGEKTFFRIPFRLSVDTRHFSTLPVYQDGVPDIFTELGNQIDGILIRSAPIVKTLPKFSLLGKVLRYVPAQYNRYYIDLSIGHEKYLQKFSSKSRSTLKRKVRKFERHCDGQLEWHEYTTPAKLEIFYRLARQISVKTYQERLLNVGLPYEKNYLSQMKALAAEDQLRAYILFCREDPVSYLFCPAQDGILFYAHLGYDPAYAKLSPGIVLHWLVFDKLLHEKKFKIFDFTEGAGEHKKIFATHSVHCADLYFLRPTLKNFIRVGAHITWEALFEALGCLLDRLRVKRALKKLIRSLSSY